MLFVALVEEIGELAKALNEQRLSIGGSLEVYSEAVQVASTAMRLATEGDSDYPDYSPSTAIEFYELYELARSLPEKKP